MAPRHRGTQVIDLPLWGGAVRCQKKELLGLFPQPVTHGGSGAEPPCVSMRTGSSRIARPFLLWQIELAASRLDILQRLRLKIALDGPATLPEPHRFLGASRVFVRQFIVRKTQVVVHRRLLRRVARDERNRSAKHLVGAAILSR